MAYPRWDELTDATAPSARWGGVGGYHSGPDAKRVVSWGGSDGSNYLNDTIALSSFDGTISSLSPTGSPPAARNLHSAFIDPMANPQRLLTFGGQDGNLLADYYRDLYQLVLTGGSEAWSALSPTPDPVEGLPDVRSMAGFILDRENYRAVLFGGYNPSVLWFNDEWILDLTTLAWTKESFAGSRPTARARFGFVYDEENGRGILFGGESNAGRLNDLYQLDLTSGSEAWSALSASGTAPTARMGMAAVYDPDEVAMWVFGGYGSGPLGAKQGTYKLTLTAGSETWSQVTGTEPPARYHSMAAYDRYRHQVRLHGGFY